MSMLHRISVRGLLTASIVALALGGCSFSYSSGSRPPSNHSHANHGKPIHKSSGGKQIDNSEKPLPSKSGEKPLTKAPVRDPEPAADPTPAPKRDDEVAPVRTKSAPKRTKSAPKRTPTPDAGDDTVETVDTGSTPGSFKAKTKPATPPKGASDTLVSPQ